MYSISDLTKRFSISRSTLLYYDTIGLLHPSGRSRSNYRQYSENDMQRMEKIALYRDAGLPLKSIIEVLEREEQQVFSILEGQLCELNKAIAKLRCQQSTIMKIIGSEHLAKKSRLVTKNQWISLLKATGLNEEDMVKWHMEFERMSPEAHQDFLESLGIEKKEILSIRKLSAADSE